MKAIENAINHKELYHYRGGLDYECDFCKSNSYDNYHFILNQELKLVFCEDCFNKIKKSDING